MALFDDTFAPYVPFGIRNLSLGDSGTDVAIVQAVYDLMLTILLRMSGQPFSINGTFDGPTQQAVQRIASCQVV